MTKSKEKKTGMNINSFIRMNLGLLIVSVGLHFFLIPANLAVGGVTGFAIVVNSFFPNLSVGTIMLMANAFLLVLAFVFLGKEFGGWTIYNSILLSSLITLLETIAPMNQAIIEDTFLVLLYGIVLQAIGLAVIFNEGTSTGGTDIIAAILNRYLHINMGRALFIADFLIALSAARVFGLTIGMYAFLGAIMNSTVIDKVIAGFNTKMKVVIVSEKHEEIVDFITQDVNRGVTILYGEGGYSKMPRRILNTLLSRKEYIIVKNKIREIDPDAFIWVNVINEVLGEGF